MYILAIDTSCDDTSASVSYGDCILSNVVSSQVSMHQTWGGVVPFLAKRMHQEMIDKIIALACKRAGVSLNKLDCIAVTYGPGLAIALEVGIKKAKELCLTYQKPLIPVNHMEGHIYSVFAKNSKCKGQSICEFPFLALLISGGHTELVLVENHGKYKILGKTLDDAIGECFDKIARALNLGYPGGPVIEKIASRGNENAYFLPIPMANKNDLNFSYSGIKTATLKLILETLGPNVSEYVKKVYASLPKNVSNKNFENRLSRSKAIADIAASFQKVCVDQLILKVSKAIDLLSEVLDQKVKYLVIAGGVARNVYLKNRFRKEFRNVIKIKVPPNKKLYTDNAGMIAVAAYFKALNKFVLNDKNDILALDRVPRLSLSN